MSKSSVRIGNRTRDSGVAARAAAGGCVRSASAAAAGRTCTTSRSTAGSGRARSSPTGRARGRWSRAPSRAARCRTTKRSSPARSTRSTVKELPFAVDEQVARPRPGALQHLLHALPRPDRRRQRHGRAARLPPAAVVSHRSAAPGGRRLFLRRDDERVRRDAGLQGADRAARSLGDRRLHPRAAVQPARGGEPTCPGGDPTKVPQTPAPAARHGAGETLDRMDTHAVTTDVPALARLQRWGLVAGFCGLLAGVVGAFLNLDQFFRSWLIGFLFCLGLVDGIAGAADAAAHVGRPVGPRRPPRLRGGEPQPAVRRAAVRAAAVRAAAALPWAQPDAVRADHILQMKAPYLNVPFFIGRAVLYFAVWSALRLAAEHVVRAQDRGEVAVDPADTRAIPGRQRARPAHLRPHDDVRVGRLDHVARPALVSRRSSASSSSPARGWRLRVGHRRARDAQPTPSRSRPI